MIMADDDHTLYTFSVDFSRPASIVSILGSWDNFQCAYPLKKEVRCGRETWRRYADFDSIVCDGDRLCRPDEGRKGSLKMGGIYWYYYQIDNDGEFCDPSQPTTRTCPFLPGQEVNILEVPIMAADSTLSAGAPFNSTSLYTLDPQEKYRTRPGKGRWSASQPARPPAPSLPTATSGAATPEKDSMTLRRPASGLLISPVSRQSHKSVSIARTQKPELDLSLPSSSSEQQQRKLTMRNITPTRPSTMPSANRPLLFGEYAFQRKVRTSTGTEEQDRRLPSSCLRLASAVSASSSKLSSRPASNMPSPRPESRRWQRKQYNAEESLLEEEERPPTDYLPVPCRASSRPGSSMQLEFDGERATDFATSMMETGFVSRSASMIKSQRGSMQRYSNGMPKLVHSNTTSTRSSTFSPFLGPSHEYTTVTGPSLPGTPDSADGFSFRLADGEGGRAPASPFPGSKGQDSHFYQRAGNYNGDGDNVSSRKRRAGMGHGYGHGSGSVLSLHDVDRLLSDSASTPARGSPHGGVEECKSSVTEIEALCRDMGYLGPVITGTESEWGP